jgi:hypothetical protein
MKRMGEMIEAMLARCKRGLARVARMCARVVHWLAQAFARTAHGLARTLAMFAEALRGRYVRVLEDEVARLRAENRALLNSLLGTVGVPPLSADAPRGPLVNAVRRRSWPQIAMQRELQEQQRRGGAASPAPQPPPARM